MDLTNLTFFRMASRKMDWISQRQTVLASNIANTDTPKFMPSEIKEIDFSKELKTGKVVLDRTNPMHIAEDLTAGVALARTNTMHILPASVSSGAFRTYDKRPFETSIDKNGVVLEEQLEKLSDNRQMHSIVTALYKKNYNMIGAALGKNLK